MHLLPLFSLRWQLWECKLNVKEMLEWLLISGVFYKLVDLYAYYSTGQHTQFKNKICPPASNF